MNLVQLLQNIGCKNARNDGMDRISSLRDGRWVEMFAEMGYDRGEFIFPDGRHSSFFLVLPDGNIASADNVMCGNGFYAIANELGIDADAVLGEEPYGEFIMYTDEDGIEDEDTAISIWTPEEFQIKLQQCQQLANKQVNETRNINKKNTINEGNSMKKKTIRLTESELKQIITESVKKILKEDFNRISQTIQLPCHPSTVAIMEYIRDNGIPNNELWEFSFENGNSYLCSEEHPNNLATVLEAFPLEEWHDVLGMKRIKFSDYLCYINNKFYRIS